MSTQPLLFTIRTGNDHPITTSGRTPAGLSYVYFIENLGSRTDKQVGIFAVSLPFVTDVHLVGIAKENNAILTVSFGTASMHVVNLEGNYSDVFSLYVEDDEQQESRVALDPSAMAYSIDFCSAYTWELVNNTLYFANDGMLPNMDIIDEFVRQLTPAKAVNTQLPLTESPQSIEKLSSIHKSTFLCPVCATALQSGRRWFSCPNGHGYMITVKDLLLTRRHMHDQHRTVKIAVGAKPSVITPVTVVDHSDLTCPNDRQPLTKALYQQTPAYLYSCAACSYRWIDGQDLDTILGAYRNDGEDKEEKDSNGRSENFGSFLMHDVDSSNL